MLLPHVCQTNFDAHRAVLTCFNATIDNVASFKVSR